MSGDHNINQTDSGWRKRQIALDIKAKNARDLGLDYEPSMKFPKHKYIRSPELMRNAREIPCQHCGIDNGTVVAAHTNWGGGKGRAVKADDNLIASLCYECHMEMDMGYHMSKEQRQDMWQKAHIKTVDKLVKLGLWPNNVGQP